MEAVLSVKENKMKPYLVRLISYILILAASCFAAWILFIKGYPTGDDIAYHFSNIYDMYTQLKSGSISDISHTLASGLGFGKNLFYSPFSHLSTCLLALLLEPFGVTLMGAFKFNMFLSVFVSGIFSYHFGYHISKKNRIALIAALIYVLYPYRFFDMFCRLAIAEAYAFLFIPLFFMGLYDLVHYEGSGLYKIYLEIILGGSLLFLTHNITSIYAYVFGVIYLLFHIKDILRIVKKDKMVLILSLVACVLLLGITAGTLFSALSLYSTGLYNVSIETRMWTNADYLAGRSDYDWYSGLLNLKYLTYITTENAILDSLYFALLTLGVPLLSWLSLLGIRRINCRNRYIKKALYCAKYLVPVILVLCSMGISFAAFSREEETYGVLLFDLLYLFYLYENHFEDKCGKNHLILTGLSVLFFILSMVFAKGVMWGILIGMCLLYAVLLMVRSSKRKKKDSGNLDLLYTSLMLLFTFILIVVPGIWYAMPSFLRSIQFPWRLWAYIAFFTSMAVPMILKNEKAEEMLILGLGGTCFLLFNNEAVREKANSYNGGDTSRWVYEIDDSLYTKWGSIGACREYFPYMYYYTDTYESSYSNSLFKKVRSCLSVTANTGMEQNFRPVVLEGDAEISDFKKGAPECSFTILVKEDETLVQLPLVYYPGYAASITDSQGNTTVLSAEEVDGLVSFTLDCGEYTLTTSYEGTGLMKLGKAYQQISVYGLFVFLSFVMLYENRKRNQELPM